MRVSRSLLLAQSLLMLSVLVATPAFARSAQLNESGPVAVPAGVSQEQVAKDIKRALISRGWASMAAVPWSPPPCARDGPGLLAQTASRPGR